MKTPVGFIIYNRPDVTERVFKRIREAKPSVLMIAADGPKDDYGDYKKCIATRDIVSDVDWECRVLRRYSDTNKGCGRGVSSAVDWFFEEAEEVIVLEDDCLPNLSFFSFCDEMLSRYRHDSRVMHISGNNFQNGISRTDCSYYFSRSTHIWGWATWHRAWKLYDFSMAQWPSFKKDGLLEEVFHDEKMVQYWVGIFDSVYRGEIDTWDCQWTFCCWLNLGLAILPAVNMVSNIGFGVGGTHCCGASVCANLPALEIGELRHPTRIECNTVADEYEFRKIRTSPPSWSSKLLNKHYYGALLRKVPVLGKIYLRLMAFLMRGAN